MISFRSACNQKLSRRTIWQIPQFLRIYLQLHVLLTIHSVYLSSPAEVSALVSGAALPECPGGHASPTKIKQRNEGLDVPYTYLLPECVPNI